MSDELVRAVAAEVRETAQRLDVSGRELARRIGMSSNTMAAKLRGDSAFDVGELDDVAQALGVDLVVLVGRARAALPPSIG